MIRAAAAAGLVWLAAVAGSARTTVPGLDGHAAIPYADGAPPGFSGAFGEQSCHACHFDEDVNAGQGHLAIEGLPERFEPERTYRLTVVLERPGMSAAGLQLTARTESDGRQAGRFAVPPDEADRLKVEERDGVQYVNQQSAGSRVDPADRTRWTILWTAPASDQPIRIAVAANAGNGDESASGDYVFTAARTVTPAR